MSPCWYRADLWHTDPYLAEPKLLFLLVQGLAQTLVTVQEEVHFCLCAPLLCCDRRAARSVCIFLFLLQVSSLWISLSVINTHTHTPACSPSSRSVRLTPFSLIKQRACSFSFNFINTAPSDLPWAHLFFNTVYIVNTQAIADRRPRFKS